MGSELWSHIILELILSDQVLEAEIFGYKEPYQAGHDLRQNFNLHWEALLEFRR
jgi:hypothetical protein